MRTLEGDWKAHVPVLDLVELGDSAFSGYRRVRRIHSYESMRQILNLGPIIEEVCFTYAPMLLRCREGHFNDYERISRNWDTWRHCIVHEPRDPDTAWYVVEEVR